jgi:hypothetical protein
LEHPGMMREGAWLDVCACAHVFEYGAGERCRLIVVHIHCAVSHGILRHGVMVHGLVIHGILGDLRLAADSIAAAAALGAR